MVTIEPTLRRRVAKATALPESLDPYYGKFMPIEVLPLKLSSSAR